MIKLYSVSHCYSSRRAKEWMLCHNITFTEVNIIQDELSTSELLHILSLTENGIDDILLERSDIYKKYRHLFEESSLRAIILFIKKHRTIIRTPLIVDQNKLLVGFTEGKASMFLPRIHKNIYLQLTTQNFYEIQDRAIL
ncbi:transcriptional regulator [Lactococcus petauri]|uniref:ArsC/Spx/MgsR family protein n=1 Tax=Lactococcus petauri TaxID=1940789 RepID=UPI0013FDBDC0|nr:ArsC/Spx/MgsR family protein [Lactococcus petauri]NHI76137.1 transcriptional regulator [Lactococcus petauri]